jgi:hypothetical protein
MLGKIWAKIKSKNKFFGPFKVQAKRDSLFEQPNNEYDENHKLGSLAWKTYLKLFKIGGGLFGKWPWDSSSKF